MTTTSTTHVQDVPFGAEPTHLGALAHEKGGEGMAWVRVRDDHGPFPWYPANPHFALCVPRSWDELDAPLPVAREVTEWGVRWGSDFVAFDTETHARAYVLSRPHGERVLVSRTRIVYPDRVSDWTEVTDR